MAKFAYTAMDAKGSESKGTLDAASKDEALTLLREKGLFPTSVVEVGEAKKDSKGTSPTASKSSAANKAAGKKGLNLNLNALWGGTGVGAKALSSMTRQLATLVDAGLPLLKGLFILMKQERNVTLKGILGELASAVESGSTFSEALYRFPKVFNRLYISMVKAGEVSGALDVVLERLAQFMEKAEKIKGKIKAALFYPIAIMVITVGILSFLMTVIVPKFRVIFSDMAGGKSLPAFTEIVLGISDLVKNNFLIVLGILVALGIAFKLFIKTATGRLLVDKCMMRMPVFGDLIRKSSIARFTRTFGTLTSSGVPILPALMIVKETSGNRVISDAIGKIHDSVKEGESIVQPLEASRAFPPMVVSMIDVGETTGALPEMLMKIADNYEDEVDNSIAAMLSLLEPIMIVFLAVVVGSIVIALFLPLIDIITRMSESQG